MARRTQAREVAVQMLYQLDLNPAVGLQAVREMVDERIEDEDLRAFCWRLVAGTMEDRQFLDARIATVARNWSLKRMAATDRNALRAGLWELLHCDTPHRVVLDEYVELARTFGGATSPQFVNGLLDRLLPDERRDP